jgi:hypothetical protein
MDIRSVFPVLLQSWCARGVGALKARYAFQSADMNY